MRHQLYYYVCCYPRRDPNCCSHLHHHFPRDSPTPSPILHCVLESPEASILTYLRLVCVVSSFSMNMTRLRQIFKGSDSVECPFSQF